MKFLLDLLLGIAENKDSRICFHRSESTVPKTTIEQNLPPENDSLPAILGGKPVRETGPPIWPMKNSAIDEAVSQCLRDGSWGRYFGPHHERLVERLSTLHQCQHAIPCASGTAAVELALRSLQIGPDDEVVMAAYDFKGNFQDVLIVGGTPVLVDLEPENWNISFDELARAVTNRTKAILISHLHGGVVNMPAVMEFAKEQDIPVIEDACQMPGAWIHGKRAGTWGDVGVLSFGGSKLLTAGRGGAVITSRDDIAQRIRLYTQRGNEAYPLSELQACVLLPQLEILDQQNELRMKTVEQLCEQLNRVPGLVPFQNSWSEDLQPGYYKLGFQYQPTEFHGLSREIFCEAMRAEGIAISPGFRALHRVHSRRRFRVANPLPIADEADERVITLHHPILLEGRAACLQFAEALKKVRRNTTAIREQLATT
ncbi:MAG: DegT/DnrJ/EryC1/StrS family aminotransferase [Planctomycetaceae bacterium]